MFFPNIARSLFAVVIIVSFVPVPFPHAAQPVEANLQTSRPDPAYPSPSDKARAPRLSSLPSVFYVSRGNRSRRAAVDPTQMLSGSPRAEQTSSAQAAQISITESGFDPEIVNITVGTDVVWTNHLGESIHLVAGEPYHVYLPLVLSGAGSPVRTSVLLISDGSQSRDWGDVDIVPGGSYTHTFTAVGDYPHFLSSRPDFTGLVVVGPLPFDFELDVEPAARSIRQGGTATHTIHVTGTIGTPQAVELSIGGVPPTASWSLSTPSVIPTDTAVLSVTTDLATPLGDHQLTITGTSGSLIHVGTTTLSMTPHPDFSLGVGGSSYGVCLSSPIKMRAN